MFIWLNPMQKRNDLLSMLHTEKIESKRKGDGIRFILGSAILVATALFVYQRMREGAYYGSGNDIWGHYFKTEMIYQGIKEGNYYPLYSPSWYNGIQLYRYWPPLSYYALAGLRFFSDGDMQTAYYLFFAAAAFLGGLPWIILGTKMKKTALGTALAVLWFFMPDTIRVFLNEGNLPRMLAIVIIPYLVMFIWVFLRKQSTFALLGVVLTTALIVLSHVMIAAMAGIATFLFLLFDCFRNRSYTAAIKIILAMLSGILMTGIWLIPALSGGLVSMNSSSTTTVLESLAFQLTAQLNPFLRLADMGPFYFGLAVFALSIVGIVFAGKKQKAGFLFVLVLVVAITPEFLPILTQFPASELFWMIRFTTFAYAFFFLSLLEWNTLRRWAYIFFVMILVLDCIPSLSFEKLSADNSRNLIEEVELIKTNTTQRASILDLSLLGSYPSWELCTGSDRVGYTFGWAWQGASTAENIVLLNTALEKENYRYIFDRSIEMGNDTVSIRIKNVGKNGKSLEDIVSAASTFGYKLIEETDIIYLFKLETPETFGVATRYEGMAIGSYANTISLHYPCFAVGNSYYIDDYQASDLIGYQTIFLSGFSYKNKEAAENLVKEISDKGVRVIIDITHVPFDSVTQRMNFLGVQVADISFVNQYPDMYYKNSLVLSGPFSEEYTVWNTQYITNVKNVIGYADYSGEKLIWGGYNDNQNVILLGFNLMFHAIDSGDVETFNLLSAIMGIDYQNLPARELVPLQVDYSAKGIVIQSPENNVNTTLAFQDIFVSDQTLEEKNNLLIVDKGKTEISFQYPMEGKAKVYSILGLLSALLIVLEDVVSKIRLRKKTYKKQEV
ncbi:MAG: 6-pyruvoyl tetrahydrobiopterin synthase [Clostridia bacterium]|nr:6-pyruvoyl tetrahydrobiopterin synthase [Clostridia bacterium]